MQQYVCMITRPMLAVNAEIHDLRYPLLATPKFDGIRSIVRNGECLSRTFKPIPNTYIRETLFGILSGYGGCFDGEIIVGNTFQDTSSAVMSFDGEPNFTYHIFDYVKDDLNKPYNERIIDFDQLCLDDAHDCIEYVIPKYIESYEQLCKYENHCLQLGYEGVITRIPESPYKLGRSTMKQQWLLKIKRFEDSEATIIGFEELMHNANEAMVDALGYTERSTCKDGMIGGNMLGNLIVQDIHTGVTFSLGSGFDHKTRQDIWNNQDAYLGKLVKYKFQPSGVKDLPRFPVYLGIRDPSDL